MSEIKLSEIRRRAQGLQSPVRLAICDLVLNDVPHLLDLVERLGKALSHSNDAIETAICSLDGLERADGLKVLAKARALLKELEL